MKINPPFFLTLDNSVILLTGIVSISKPFILYNRGITGCGQDIDGAFVNIIQIGVKDPIQVMVCLEKFFYIKTSSDDKFGFNKLYDQKQEEILNKGLIYRDEILIPAIQGSYEVLAS